MNPGEASPGEAAMGGIEMMKRPHFAILPLAILLLLPAGQAAADLARWETETTTMTPDAGEESLFEMTNEVRNRRDLMSLLYCPHLSEVARDHARDMIRNDYFAHTDSDDLPVTDRLRSAGAEYSRVAENPAGHDDSSLAHESLVASRGHRATTVGDFDRMDIAVVEGGSYGYIIVGVFVADLADESAPGEMGEE